MSLEKPNVGSCMHEFKVNRKQAFSLLIITALLLSSLVVLIKIPSVQATTIFEDDFEAGDFSQWTSNTTSAGCVSEVVTTAPHHGTYNAHFTTNGTADWQNAEVTKTISASNITYARGYFTLNSITGTTLRGFITFSNTLNEIARLGLSSSNALILRYRNGTSISTDTSATTLTTDVTHCLELYAKIDASAGEYKVYLDGTEIADISQEGLDTDQYTVTTVAFGIENAYSTAVDLSLDCAVVADAYIGLETGTDTYTLTPTEASFTYNTTVEDAACQFKLPWSTNGTLGHYIGSSNASGTWENGTETAFADEYSYLVVTLPKTGNVTSVIFYADLAENTTMIASEMHNLTSTASYTVYAASGTVDAIQAAIDNVYAHGDGTGTVYIPEGTFTFNPSGITGPRGMTGVISYGGVNIIGAGIGKTILQETHDSPVSEGYGCSMLAVDGSNNKTFVISGITFQGYVSTESNASCGLQLVSCTDYRVTNCSFDSFSSKAIECINVGNKINRGLIDHCSFSNSYKTADPSAWSWGYGVMVWDLNQDAWSDISTLLGQYAGAKDIVYIENCNFNQCRHAVTECQNGYYVIRNCIISDTIPSNYGSIDVHGVNFGRGCEAYNNTVIGNGAGQAVWLRGGVNTVFNNTFVNCSYGVMLFNESATKYQVQNTYIWGNTMETGTLFSNSGNYTENVDYFLIERPDYTPYPFPHYLTLDNPEPEPTPSAPTGGPGGVTGETYTVTIIVHNSSKVLGNVEVRLGNLYAYTDSEGKATFVGVVAGFYELKVYVEGQVKYENSVDVEGDKTVMVDLNKPGQPPVDVGEVDVSGFGFEVPVWVIIGFIGVLFAMLAFRGRGGRRRRNR